MAAEKGSADHQGTLAQDSHAGGELSRSEPACLPRFMDRLSEVSGEAQGLGLNTRQIPQATLQKMLAISLATGGTCSLKGRRSGICKAKAGPGRVGKIFLWPESNSKYSINKRPGGSEAHECCLRKPVYLVRNNLGRWDGPACESSRAASFI